MRAELCGEWNIDAPLDTLQEIEKYEKEGLCPTFWLWLKKD